MGEDEKFQQLPLEIIEAIIRQTERRQDLLSWTFVSIFCNRIASSMLYNTILFPLRKIPFAQQPRLLYWALEGDAWDKRVSEGGWSKVPGGQPERGVDSGVHEIKTVYGKCCRNSRGYGRLVGRLVNTRLYAKNERINHFIRSIEFNDLTMEPFTCNLQNCRSGSFHQNFSGQLFKRLLPRLPALRSLKLYGMEVTSSSWALIGGMKRLEEFVFVIGGTSGYYLGQNDNKTSRLPPNLKRLKLILSTYFHDHVAAHVLFKALKSTRLEEFTYRTAISELIELFKVMLDNNFPFPKTLKKLYIPSILATLYDGTVRGKSGLKALALWQLLQPCSINLTHLALEDGSQFVQRQGWHADIENINHTNCTDFLMLCDFPNLSYLELSSNRHAYRNYAAYGRARDPFMFISLLVQLRNSLRVLRLHTLYLPALQASTEAGNIESIHNEQFANTLGSLTKLVEFTWGCTIRPALVLQGDSNPNLAFQAEDELLQSSTSPVTILSLPWVVKTYPDLERLQVKLDHIDFGSPALHLELYRILSDNLESKLRLLVIASNIKRGSVIKTEHVSHDTYVYGHNSAKLARKYCDFSGKKYFTNLRSLELESTITDRPLLDSKEGSKSNTSNNFVCQKESAEALRAYDLTVLLAERIHSLRVVTFHDLRFYIERIPDSKNIKHIWHLADALDSGIIHDSSLRSDEWYFLGRGKQPEDAMREICCVPMYGKVWSTEHGLMSTFANNI